MIYGHFLLLLFFFIKCDCEKLNKVLPPLTSNISEGSYKCLFRFMIQEKSQTKTRVIKLPEEMPKSTTKALANMCLGATIFLL